MPFENPAPNKKNEDVDSPLYTRRELTKAAGTGLAVGAIGATLVSKEIFGTDDRKENKTEEREGGYESSELFNRAMAVTLVSM